VLCPFLDISSVVLDNNQKAHFSSWTAGRSDWVLKRQQ
jgi:hypothetical protein